MGQVGYFGTIKFRCKTDSLGKPQILSFENASWTSGINVEQHARRGKKPLIEEVDRKLDEFKMDVYLSADLGISPLDKILKIRTYCLSYKVFPLVIGGKRIGSGGNKFMVTDISNALVRFYKNGHLVAAKTSVTFLEYPVKRKRKLQKGLKEAREKRKEKRLAEYVELKTEHQLQDNR